MGLGQEFHIPDIVDKMAKGEKIKIFVTAQLGREGISYNLLTLEN